VAVTGAGALHPTAAKPGMPPRPGSVRHLGNPLKAWTLPLPRFRSYAAAACHAARMALVFLGCGACGGTLGNARGDQEAAELGEHVLEGGLGLGGVPGLGVAAGGDAGRAAVLAELPQRRLGGVQPEFERVQ
jgi:hypothetical protein